jgi:hypothetical protein
MTMTRESIEAQRQRFDSDWHGGRRASYPPTLYCVAGAVWEGAGAEAKMRGECVPPTIIFLKDETT